MRSRPGLSRWLMIPLGLLFVLLGVVTFWLPLPIGLPLMLLGALILLRHSRHARRLAASTGRRYPAFRQLLRRRRPARRPLDAEAD